jgi:hypothetical protein
MRTIDRWLIRRFGASALPLIWGRSHIRKRLSSQYQLLSPTVIRQERYELAIAEPTIKFVMAFRATPPPHLPAYYNGCNFSGSDLLTYDYMLHKYRPQRLLEVGCGGSTQYAAYTGRQWGLEIRCIDPEPRTVMPTNVAHLRKLVQDVPLSEFDRLRANDFLFIDSSHTTAEACYHIQHILPRLEVGVIVHYHDIYYPFGVHADWGEQAVILDFVADNPDKWAVLTSNAYAYQYDQ